MATQYEPIVKDSTLNTTEQTPRNLADVLAEGLEDIANNVKPDGSDISIDVPGMSANNVDDGFSELKQSLNNKSNVLMTRSYGHSFSINANGYAFWNPRDTQGDNINIDGYTILGIVELSTNNSNVVYVNVTSGDSSYGMFLRNISNDTQTGTFNYKVLYVKNT